MDDVRECRICLTESNDEESLIQPCKCNTAYVHEGCLQKWRDENIDNDKHKKCEICNENYMIERQYKLETFEIYIRPHTKCSLICSYITALVCGSLTLNMIDWYFNQYSLNLLNFGKKDKRFLKDLGEKEIPWFIYYLSYASYIYCMLFFSYVFFGVFAHVHRKKIYWRKNLCIFIIYFLIGWNYFYNFLFFYKTQHNILLYMAISLFTLAINFLIMKQYARRHDKTIRKLNSSNRETIISIGYNPLIEIAMIDQEADDVPLALSNSASF